MPVNLAKSVCCLYAGALAAFGLAMVMFPWNIIIVIGLWASAIGLALRFRGAFGPAYAVALLNIVGAAADGLSVRLPLSGIFSENLARHYLLESPAQFFFWYGSSFGTAFQNPSRRLFSACWRSPRLLWRTAH